MRCPKCGFHSFDYLDNCKKCGGDLTDLKLRFRFQGYVAPPPVLAVPAPAAEGHELPEAAEEEEEAIDFGFDVLDEDAIPALAAEAAAGGEADIDFDAPAAVDHAAIDLAADSGLILDQSFTAEGEKLPDDDLPAFDSRNGF